MPKASDQLRVNACAEEFCTERGCRCFKLNSCIYRKGNFFNFFSRENVSVNTTNLCLHAYDMFAAGIMGCIQQCLSSLNDL